MKSIAWISQICKDWRQSQVKTLAAIWEAFFPAKTAILNEIALELTKQTGVAINHTLKRINRFLGNQRIDREAFFEGLIKFVLPRVQHWPIIPIAIDWTYCEDNNPWQSLVASITFHGRGIPIYVWSFKRNCFDPYMSQNQVEEAFVAHLRRLLPKHKRIVILADRGFARISLFEILLELGFEFVIRLKYNVKVKSEGKKQLLGDIAVKRGEKLQFNHVTYREDESLILPRIIIARPTEETDGMDPWFLASSLCWSAERLTRLYAKRMIIEEDFRTAKTELNWEDCKIRKVEHYRQFTLLMVLTLVFSMLLGTVAKQKESLAKGIVKKRKGKFDSSIMRIGLRLLYIDVGNLRYLERLNRLKAAFR